MSERDKPAEWRVIGETVPGASHLRAGVPNQDSILFVRGSSSELPIVVSVADGHGSPKCFRSDRGSRFAVKKAVFLISEFLDERRGRFDIKEIDGRREEIAKEFVHRWREAVEADLAKEPFAESEFDALEKKSGPDARKLVEENPLLAYGTTSLTVAVEHDFAVYMQLGDGDILNISGSQVTKPLPEDARLLANETTSMCLPKADKDIRFHVQEFPDGEGPQMILLSTDGYLNSFASEAGFFQAGTDILAMLAETDGHDTVSDNLKAWLEEATKMGSGDDCTVAIIYRPEAIKKPADTDTPQPDATKVENPPSAETSKAIAALTDSEAVTPQDLDDVTVTITIKKDKNKISRSSSETERGKAHGSEDNAADRKPSDENESSTQ